jgi:hypothetical protein
VKTISKGLGISIKYGDNTREMELRVNHRVLAVRVPQGEVRILEPCCTEMPRVPSTNATLRGTTWAIRAEALRSAFTRELGILLRSPTVRITASEPCPTHSRIAANATL